MVARQCPMRPRCAHTNGVTENSASLTRLRLYAGAGECRRRRSAAHVRRRVYPRRGRGVTESVTARAVGSGWWGSSASPKRCVVCGVCSPMRPPLRSVRMGFLKNSASPMRGRAATGVEVAHLRSAVGMRSGSGLSGGERRVDQENVVGGTCERRV